MPLRLEEDKMDLTTAQIGDVYEVYITYNALSGISVSGTKTSVYASALVIDLAPRLVQVKINTMGKVFKLWIPIHFTVYGKVIGMGGKALLQMPDDTIPPTQRSPKMISDPICSACGEKAFYATHDQNQGKFVCSGCKLRSSVWS